MITQKLQGLRVSWVNVSGCHLDVCVYVSGCNCWSTVGPAGIARPRCRGSTLRQRSARESGSTAVTRERESQRGGAIHNPRMLPTPANPPPPPPRPLPIHYPSTRTITPTVLASIEELPVIFCFSYFFRISSSNSN